MEHVSSVLPTGKFPEKVENLKRWDCFPERNFVFHLSVSPSLYQFQAATVGHSDVPGFTTKWNNFLPIGNSTFAPIEISAFFLNGKSPRYFRSDKICQFESSRKSLCILSKPDDNLKVIQGHS